MLDIKPASLKRFGRYYNTIGFSHLFSSLSGVTKYTNVASLHSSYLAVVQLGFEFLYLGDLSRSFHEVFFKNVVSIFPNGE